MASNVDPNMLGGWCKVGSKVVSDYYAAESDYIRTVTKIIVYPDGIGDHLKNSNGYVTTDGGYDKKTGEKGRPLDRVIFRDFIKPIPKTEL